MERTGTIESPIAGPRQGEALLRAALTAYGLEGAEAVPLAQGIHSTYKVDDRFVLRIYGAGLYSEAAIASEAAWLASLRREAGLLVPEPVPTAGGSPVARLAGGDGEALYAVLFHWVPGERPDGPPTATAFRRLGELMGRLHRHGGRFVPPAGFERPRYDLDRLLGTGPAIETGTGEGLILEADRAWLDEAATLVRREIGALGEGRDVFGLIHGDLQVTNFVFHRGEVGAIDFADFGWGYHLYDVAASLLPSWGQKGFAELQEAMLRGYRQVRPLAEAHVALLDTFLAARGLFVLRWTVESWDTASVREASATLVPLLKSQLRRFVEQRSGGRAAADGAGRSGGVVQLLARLAGRGIKLWEEDGQIRFKAPREAMTPELRAELAARKSEVVVYLRQQGAAAAAPAAPPLGRAPRDRALPLSFAQQRLWILDQFEPGNPVYNISQAVRLEGAIRVNLLERSFHEIVRRHEALRTTFAIAGDQPEQVIASHLAPPLPVIDLAALPADARRAESRRLINEEASSPFDLASGPLLRFPLVRLGRREHLLILTLHHIVSDGWSRGLLIRELAALYDAYSAGRPSPLPELPIQYADFAVWQREWLRGEVLEAQLSYWRGRLEGAPEALELPSDRPRPPVQTYRGGRRAVALPRRLTEALERLSRGREASLFMTLLAAFAVLLHRYTGREDLVVGSPIANRNRAEIEGLIGFFINTLVLRAAVAGDAGFGDLLERVREVTLGAYAHQDLPFERLVDELQPGRDASHSPLFQVMFGLQNAPSPVLESPGVTFSFEDPDKTTAKFDLVLSLGTGPPGVQGSLTYNSDLFDAPTAGRMAAHFEALLEGIAADPETRVGELPLLGAAERSQALLEWSDTARECPQEPLVHELFAAHARRRPEALAVVTAAGRLTYGELEARANRLAHHLRALGVGPEARVAVCAERTAARVVGIVAVLKAGGVYASLDPGYPRERLEFLLADARAPVLLTEERFRDALPDTGAAVLCLDAGWEGILGNEASPPVVRVAQENLAYIVYTSGSTGQPKGVMIPHAGLMNLVRWHQGLYGVTPEDRGTQVASPAFDASIWEMWPYLAAGSALHIPDEEARLSAAGMLRWWSREGITLAYLPTPLAEGVLEEDIPPDLPLAVRALIIGGDRLHRGPSPAAGFRLMNHYGPAEYTVTSTVVEVPPLGQGRGVPTIGRAVDNTRLHVLDRSLQPVPVGVPGELYVGGVGLARGYFDRPALTAEKFLPDPFARLAGEPGARLYRTGDLVRWLPDGDLDFLGRLDHQVKIRGLRVELGEIEAVLGQYPSVREAAVLLEQADSAADKRLVAYLTLAGGAPAVEDLRRFLRQKLPAYMVPSAFVLLEALPLTPNGKVDRRVLEKAGGTRLELRESYVAPRTPVEDKLATVWAELLGRERIGIHDNFFDLGGNSLLATQLVSRLRLAFQVELPFSSFFEGPTVADLAENVEVARRVVEDGRKTRGEAAGERDEGEL